MNTLDRLRTITLLCAACGWSERELEAHVRATYPRGLTPDGPAWTPAIVRAIYEDSLTVAPATRA